MFCFYIRSAQSLERTHDQCHAQPVQESLFFEGGNCNPIDGNQHHIGWSWLQCLPRSGNSKLIVTSTPDEVSESLVCLGQAHAFSDELPCPQSLQGTRHSLSSPVNRIRMCPQVQPSVWPWVIHIDGEGAGRNVKGQRQWCSLAAGSLWEVSVSLCSSGEKKHPWQPQKCNSGFCQGREREEIEKEWTASTTKDLIDVGVTKQRERETQCLGTLKSRTQTHTPVWVQSAALCLSLFIHKRGIDVFTHILKIETLLSMIFSKHWPGHLVKRKRG